MRTASESDLENDWRGFKGIGTTGGYKNWSYLRGDCGPCWFRDFPLLMPLKRAYYSYINSVNVGEFILCSVTTPSVLRASPVACGYCGGDGCGTRNGVNCCTSATTDSCSKTGSAPCVMDRECLVGLCWRYTCVYHGVVPFIMCTYGPSGRDGRCCDWRFPSSNESLHEGTRKIPCLQSFRLKSVLMRF